MLVELYNASGNQKKVIREMGYHNLKAAHAKLLRDEPDRTDEIESMGAELAIRDAAHADSEAALADATRDPEESLAPIGHNNPPEPIPALILTPCAAGEPDSMGALRAHFDDLYTETANWADGQEIETEAQAHEVDKLIDLWKEAIKGAEEVRDAEIAPLNEQIKAVRERFYPLIGDTTKIKGLGIRAKTALLQVKTKWGERVRLAQQAEASRLAKEAADKVREAAEATRAAQGDLQAAEAAEDLIRDAKAMIRTATTAAKATPGKGYRTEWVTEITDPTLALRTMWRRFPDEFSDLALSLARREVREGKRALEGFAISETKVAV